MDPARREILCGWIEIEDGKIKALGEGDAPREALDMSGDLIMPGMVNTHCHMAMTLFRGLGEDVDDRLYRYILPLERDCVTADVVRAGSELAALELIRGGVTCVADMYYFEDVVGEVIDQSGLRGIVGQTIGDFSPPDHHSFDEGFARCDALVDRFGDHPRVIPSIAPHAPYSTGPDVMQRVAEWAEDNPGARVQMHLAESEHEMRWCADNYRVRPVELVAQSGLLRDGLIAAHCLHIDEAEAVQLAEAGVGVAHNARSNGKAGRGIAPVAMMRERGVRVGLASDGAMSGNTLDLFAQMAPASMFQSIANGSRSALPARDIVAMATIEGADVLGLQARIGSLEPGKSADLIRVSLDEPRAQPLYDIYSALVFVLSAGDIRATMVAGEWLMRDGAVATLEQERIVANANRIAKDFETHIEQLEKDL
ncbi:amidohydrolase family protein [Hoeflea prorocentri]|uniref:Amidohydrolase n=1 Tax=Hoeflea prorocentri TaxID=1922333 RepID=A0A9X3UMR7_9HYPH|nr:amidohydrolase [Hoeflea prorocentri]MCY6383484.1 amidohydrolase [Hoeflea prorocentri]MDA5401284.1 amidohydrolase [Hoeflea prorocentri]